MVKQYIFMNLLQSILFNILFDCVLYGLNFVQGLYKEKERWNAETRNYNPNSILSPNSSQTLTPNPLVTLTVTLTLTNI